MKRHLSCVLLLALIAPPAFSRIRLDTISIYFTGTLLLNGRQQIASSTRLMNIDGSGNPAPTDWRTIHGFEDAFTRTAIATTGVRLTSGATTYSNTFMIYGAFSTCYRARIEATVSDGDNNAYGSSQLCTAGPPINPPCESLPEGCGRPVPACRGEDGCWDNCPLIVNLGQGAWRLSGVNDAVVFDIDADGKADRIGWTERGSDLAFIALDRNGNGRIDDGTELFGDHTPLTNGALAGNGFAALRELDANRDGIVNASDPVWQQLSLWVDANHDGKSQANELRPIRESEVEGLGTEYQWSGRTDSHGNAFRWKSQIFKVKGREPYYDIFFIGDRSMQQ